MQAGVPQVEESSECCRLYHYHMLCTYTYWTLCMCGIGSMTDFSRMSAMLVDAKMRSELYPFFILEMLKF